MANNAKLVFAILMFVGMGILFWLKGARRIENKNIIFLRSPSLDRWYKACGLFLIIMAVVLFMGVIFS